MDGRICGGGTDKIFIIRSIGLEISNPRYLQVSLSFDTSPNIFIAYALYKTLICLEFYSSAT
jgi:hypothetical protein